MLGRLAKYLLHAGFDCEYDSQLNDSQLTKRAYRNDRVLLTRDRDMLDQFLTHPKRTYVISDHEIDEQLRRLQLAFNLEYKVENFFTRCSSCNKPLKEVPLDSVIDQLPADTANWIDTAYRCPDCGKLYWLGSHYRDVIENFRRWELLEE
jgi:hypothetical protein